jgi:hypothetical protein
VGIGPLIVVLAAGVLAVVAAVAASPSLRSALDVLARDVGNALGF